MIIPKLAMKGGKEKILLLDQGQSLIIWFILFFTMMIFSLYKEDIFPIYYFWDANTISSLLNSAKFIYADSYQSTAAFFSIFGVTRESYWFSLFSTGIIIFYYIIALRKSNVDIIYLKEYLVLIYC
ncbi:hypothetical protein B6V83_18630, partial [Klebsiella pneumoniae]